MKSSDIFGTLGVTLLLLAFFLNLFGWIQKESKGYILLNFAGAALACYASVLIKFLPFIILEGTWSFVALIAFIRVLTRSKRSY
ncbi:MAG: hypothetical protein K9H16_08250 [Bacteroidales bacterium]|nr:hypothetical protein [Bacteroidales bacterium]